MGCVLGHDSNREEGETSATRTLGKTIYLSIYPPIASFQNYVATQEHKETPSLSQTYFVYNCRLYRMFRNCFSSWRGTINARKGYPRRHSLDEGTLLQPVGPRNSKRKGCWIVSREALLQNIWNIVHCCISPLKNTLRSGFTRRYLQLHYIAIFDLCQYSYQTRCS